MPSVPCPFCDPREEEILFRSLCWYARSDLHPVTPGHLLLIPFRHFPTYFDLTPEEWSELGLFTMQAKKFLDRTVTPDGYNIGVNVGRSAGQAVMHLHIHMIPRFWDDSGVRKGGVRRSVPGKEEAGLPVCAVPRFQGTTPSVTRRVL